MRGSVETDTANITMRVAGRGDAAALTRLAALDSGRVPAGGVLVAEADGELVAALSLDGGGVVADPFRHTAALVEMLELRAAQLRSCDERRPAPALAEHVRAAARWLGPSTRLP